MKSEGKNSYKYAGIDFVGQRHGRLIVTGKAERGRSWWHCKCDCGKSLDLPTWKFLTYQSCGCLERENKEHFADHTRTHGMTKSRLYSVWCGMKDRCFNPNTEHYDRYGGRGISMCDEWRNSFESFRDWAYANGYKDTLTGKDQSIDRIDVSKDYCPNNCRWVNQSQQMRNKERSMFVQFNGEKLHIIDFCQANGITYPHFVFRRIAKGVPTEQILKEWNFANGNHPGYLDMTEASAFYGVGYQSLKQWIDKGWIKAERIGQHWFIPEGQMVSRKSGRGNNGRFIKGIKRTHGIAELG